MCSLAAGPTGNAAGHWAKGKPTTAQWGSHNSKRGHRCLPEENWPPTPGAQTGAGRACIPPVTPQVRNDRPLRRMRRRRRTCSGLLLLWLLPLRVAPSFCHNDAATSKSRYLRTDARVGACVRCSFLVSVVACCCAWHSCRAQCREQPSPAIVPASVRLRVSLPSSRSSLCPAPQRAL
jgi:hypothetical protein